MAGTSISGFPIDALYSSSSMKMRSLNFDRNLVVLPVGCNDEGIFINI